MKLTKTIYFLIGLAILLILTNAVFFTHLVTLNQRYYTAESNSHHIVQTASELLSVLREAETSRRGFVLTGDPDLSSSFFKSQTQFKLVYDSLKKLIASQYKPADIEKLDQLLYAQIDTLVRSVELIQDKNTQEALALIRSKKDRQLIIQVDTEVGNLIEEEKRRLTEYQLDLKKYTHRTKIYSIVSNVTLFLIALSSYFNIRNNRKNLRKLFSEVEEKNSLLEEQTTDLQRLSHDLIQQNRELERFAYVASHDLRAPAANIEALLRLYGEAKNQQERETIVDTMHDVSENLSNKLNDLVEVLRGKNEVNQFNENLSFEKVFEKVLKNLSVEIRKSSAKIHHDFTDAPTVSAPKSYLESILQNLVSNALKYRHPKRKPEITIRSFKNAARICFEVRDNGLGIDLKKHGTDLFGLYKTFHNHRDSKGVGLYITRAQILSLGGRIEVESQPGEGTKFTVCL